MNDRNASLTQPYPALDTGEQGNNGEFLWLLGRYFAASVGELEKQSVLERLTAITLGSTVSDDVIAQAITRWDFKPMFEIGGLSELQFLTVLLYRVEEWMIKPDILWLANRESIDVFTNCHDTIIHFLVAMFLCLPSDEVRYIVATDYAYELINSDIRVENMNALLYVLCLFIEEAGENRAYVEVTANTYLLEQSEWNLMDWKLAHIMLELGISHLEVTEIQKRITELNLEALLILEKFGIKPDVHTPFFMTMTFQAKKTWLRQMQVAKLLSADEAGRLLNE